jgi:hypothetical protein
LPKFRISEYYYGNGINVAVGTDCDAFGLKATKQIAILTTNARKHKNTKKKKIKFRAHAAQGPVLRVPIVACPVKPSKV